MDATKLPKLKSAEVNTGGQPKNLPGTYTHKDTHAVYITSPGEEGSIQADSLMSPLWQNAWERTGDVPSREELLKMRKVQEMKDVLIEAQIKKDEAAELAALEAEIAGEKKAPTVKAADLAEVPPPVPAPGTGAHY